MAADYAGAAEREDEGGEGEQDAVGNVGGEDFGLNAEAVEGNPLYQGEHQDMKSADDECHARDEFHRRALAEPPEQI